MSAYQPISSAETVKLVFVAAMVKCFDDPPGSDEDGFFDELVSSLRAFDEQALRAGARAIIRSRSSRRFPSIGECVKACEAEVPRERRKADTDMEREKEGFAIRIARGALGQRAWQEGWGYALFDFVQSHLRTPNEEEELDLVDLAKRNDDLLRRDRASLIPIEIKVVDAVTHRREVIRGKVHGHDGRR
ncbi:conserved hypothetical protein [Hyphomicrobiales bacterium]|nr:hypothetical protein CHELA1G2_11428 [Hyphomicrobiales bacterium]CAH1667773.1 conserved hypothetical protein [Hyphomicrobiales bacterium]